MKYTNKNFDEVRSCLSDIKDKYGITFKEMSMTIGVPAARFYDFRNNGYKPKLEEIIDLAKAINLDTEDRIRLLIAAGYENYVLL